MKEKEKRKGPKPPKKITERYLYNSGLYYLQRYPASTGHFKRVMGRKIDKSCRHHTEQSKEDCLKLLDDVTDRLVNEGYMDDEMYLRAMVTSLRRKGLSKRLILNRLQAKAIPSADIMEAVTKYDDIECNHENPELAAAIIFAQRKKIGLFSKQKNTDEDPKQHQKDLGKLARAGFSYDICSKILSGDIEY